MSLGIKSSAFLRVEDPFSRKFEVQIFLIYLQLYSGYAGEKLFQEFGPIFFDMSSTNMVCLSTIFSLWIWLHRQVNFVAGCSTEVDNCHAKQSIWKTLKRHYDLLDLNTIKKC